MKKLAILATITAGVISLSACSSDNSEAVVEMDQGDITKEEFYEKLKETSGETVLQNMVYSLILEDKYEIDEDYVDEQIDSMKDQYGESFEMALQQSGFQSEEDYREALRLHLLEQEAITEDIEVTDEEIETRYERMSTEIEASHILVEDEETANDLYDQLLDGADFAELAEEHSTDTGSASEGGQLGYFSAGDMVAEFEDKAYSLGVDEIGEPVQSTHGWHIIKVTDIRETDEEIEPLEDMKDTLRTEIALSQVDQEVAMNKMQSLFEEANIQVNIEEFEDLFNFDDPAATDDGETETEDADTEADDAEDENADNEDEETEDAENE
ncbi:peptidylprolyl isomerase [Amphibacillus sp. MSJ-3]|uniref:peptidylprolyl isomerase n=1 Tax=Amphibacillus sp. MSJ-3 TaxID=2841505 RepID=UPI001C0F06F2|nr:peptidylprolyl isomerase [Amphibacillus sp. MSJ-3]MBU5593999.1 peptidylprolyl isomerase [Amphibacillus sp. MSJ-3]